MNKIHKNSQIQSKYSESKHRIDNLILANRFISEEVLETCTSGCPGCPDFFSLEVVWKGNFR